MERELDIEEELKAGVNVRLRKNPLANDGSLIPEVSARKATVEDTISLIAKETTGIDASAMLMYLDLYNKKILGLLKMGYKVEVMGLGTLNIKLKGKASSAAEAARLSDFTVRFRPSKKAVEAVKGLVVDEAVVPDRAPLIESVKDLSRGEADGQVTAGNLVRLSGQRLKLAEGDGNFVAFVPQDESGRDEPDEAKWLFLKKDKVFTNKPAELLFIAPEGLEAGAKYRIRVSTTFANTRVIRKEPLWGESEAVTAVG